MACHAAIQRQAGSTVETLRANPSAIRLLALAALIGPVLGVSLSLLAVQNTAVGVASVLTSLAPIFMLPLSYFFFKERLGWQPIAGTFLAMSGVVVLFLDLTLLSATTVQYPVLSSLLSLLSSRRSTSEIRRFPSHDP